MTFPRYPEYKDSGVPWLGEVPAHWEVCSLKRIVRMQSGDSITSEVIDETGEFPVYGGNGLRGYGSRFTHDGNFVLIGRQGALCGNINYAVGKFWASEHAIVVSPIKPVITKWLGELLRAMNLNQYSISAAQPGLSVDSIARLTTCVPSTQEQAAIANFLEREASKIDELVAEQQRLLELLNEKREAVISHAVTKGLNPDASMKPSGVEWLGEVPAHWEVMQSRRLFKVRNEPAHESDRQLTASQKHGILLQSEFVESEGRRVVEVIKGADSLKHVEPNDFVISMRSFQGGIEWSRLRGSISWHYVMLTPIKSVHGPFFAYLLKSPGYIQALRSTADLIRDGQELRYSHFIQVDLPLIPINEQARIASFLDHETAKIDALMAEAQRAIDLLQERRTALISAAVTGQIDVRAIAGKAAA
ncbi:restriction endonuclease subunit S [Corallococcus sp. AB011P]|uniref:restriction endonuclease subunit S n=1 Tax=Corallococcus sp. AB011P TaxID=2316735 RepID=UPI000EA3D3A6|nr:restriction endonuclease subunit S [Corallococcus sp. AB011P]RKG60824.1 restriction endonuclease subunit S [Corallococcus sp. AB011P]